MLQCKLTDERFDDLRVKSLEAGRGDAMADERSSRGCASIPLVVPAVISG